MAHFAELDGNNIVTRVIVVHNNELLNNGLESESKGIAFCQSLFGGNWLQTSYNGNIRYNYAGIGFTYDQVNDAFIAPKPFNSWVLNKADFQWQAPKPKPVNGMWGWDEENLAWQELLS